MGQPESRAHLYVTCLASKSQHPYSDATLYALDHWLKQEMGELKAAIALYITYYNFYRIHSSIRSTPAIEAGITKTVWTMKELLSNA